MRIILVTLLLLLIGCSTFHPEKIRSQVLTPSILNTELNTDVMTEINFSSNKAPVFELSLRANEIADFEPQLPQFLVDANPIRCGLYGFTSPKPIKPDWAISDWYVYQVYDPIRHIQGLESPITRRINFTVHLLSMDN